MKPRASQPPTHCPRWGPAVCMLVHWCTAQLGCSGSRAALQKCKGATDAVVVALGEGGRIWGGGGGGLLLLQHSPAPRGLHPPPPTHTRTWRLLLWWWHCVVAAGWGWLHLKGWCTAAPAAAVAATLPPLLQPPNATTVSTHTCQLLLWRWHCVVAAGWGWPHPWGWWSPRWHCPRWWAIWPRWGHVVGAWGRVGTCRGDERNILVSCWLRNRNLYYLLTHLLS
jgi:hypothetical protein